MDPTFQPQNQNDIANGLDHDTSAAPTTPATSVTSATTTATTTSATSATPTSSTVSTTPAPSTFSAAPVSQTPSPSTTPTSTSDATSMGGSELDSLMNELNNYQPENDASLTSVNNLTSASTAASADPVVSDRPQFSPSDNLTQTATVSASVQGQASNTSPDFTDDLSTQSEAAQTSATPAQGTIEPDEEDEENEEDKPLTAAAPVPGSIGSAVSYTDVEKKQAEEAAKQAKNQNKPKVKLTSTAILAIIVGGLLAITGIIFAIIMLSSPKKAPAEATGKNQVAQAESKSLTCVRPLSTNETAEAGAAYGNFERQFEFKNNALESINENYVYQFNSAEAATAAKTSIDSNNSNANTTTTVNINQLKKTTKITTENLDSYIKSVAELSSTTGHDLNSFLVAENQTGLSCSTIE